MSAKKQTAVEWLVQQIFADHTSQWQKEIAKAKEMDRRQNEYTWIAGAEYALSFLKDKTSEDSKESFKQYYNETYGKE